MGGTRFLHLPEEAQRKLILGARDVDHVRGLTHDFYKYPARFSPNFARAASETFTKPGDLVLDPHVGGGTTIVEALAVGREAVGVDRGPVHTPGPPVGGEGAHPSPLLKRGFL
jgi:DNA modification methylase